VHSRWRVSESCVWLVQRKGYPWAEEAVCTWKEELRPPKDSRGLPSPRAGLRSLY
jgi:hypothetical protein